MYFLYQISMKSTFWQKIVQALLIRLHICIWILAENGVHSDIVHEMVFSWMIFE